MENKLPQYFEETILKYLKTQEVYGEGDFKLEVDDEKKAPLEDIRSILENIIFQVNRRVACKDRYENIQLWHNQYGLFDLGNVIPDFCIDENIIKKICFQESLLISELNPITGSREVKPMAVGGLCLNVQVVDGHISEERPKTTDADLDNEIFQTLQRAKQVMAKKSTENNSDLDILLEQKLTEYEVFLKQEMMHNVKKFIVHLSSQFDCGGHNSGSTITSWVDRNFHTLEEKEMSMNVLKLNL